MMEHLKYLLGNFHFMQGPVLDRDKWQDDKEGMDFIEAPSEAQDFSFNPEFSDVADWIIILRYLAIVVLGALLIFVAVRLVSRNQTKSNRKLGSVSETTSDEEEGPTALSPLEELWTAYQKAKADKNYKEAVRILYQIVVKHLDSHGKLSASLNKTNREYAQEMNWQEKTKDFLQLTLLHEFTWYGSKEVDQLDFDRAESRFLTFIESIKNG